MSNVLAAEPEWDPEARAEPFIKARKARVLSGAEIAWSVRNFLIVLLVERVSAGAGAVVCVSDFDCCGSAAAAVGGEGYEGNQDSRSSCQR